MKKKIISVASKFKRSEVKPTSGRITNETVAEHRERVLAGGRRFKYPVQYARVRLIRNTIIIVLLAIISFGAFVWWQLYPQQNTSDFFYRITQILPLPVAKVNNQNAPYSYYLLTLRSAVHYLETNANTDFSTNDGKRQMAYLKRTALNDAISYGYALKLASARNIGVSDKEVNDFINKIRGQNKVSVNQAAFESSIYKFYGWSYDEFKESTMAKLLVNKVTREIDTDALKRADTVLAKIRTGEDFSQLAKETSDDPGVQQSSGDQGLVAKDSQDPNGLVATAAGLQPGQTSGLITGTDGYYFVKLIDKNDTSVHFSRIFIAYKAFDTQLSDLRKQGKIQEFISVPTNTAPVQQN